MSQNAYAHFEKHMFGNERGDARCSSGIIGETHDHHREWGVTYVLPILSFYLVNLLNLSFHPATFLSSLPFTKFTC